MKHRGTAWQGRSGRGKATQDKVAVAYAKYRKRRNELAGRGLARHGVAGRGAAS